jgi:hypothetical protein
MRCRVAPTSGGALGEGVVGIMAGVFLCGCLPKGHLSTSGSTGTIHYIEFMFEIQEKHHIIEQVQNTYHRIPHCRLAGITI